MIVKRVTDIAEVLRIVPIEVKLRQKEKSDIAIKDVLTFVQGQLQSNPYFGIWIVEDGEDVAGYVGLFINVIGRQKSLYIWRIWHDPHRPEVMLMLQDIIAECASNTKTDKIRIEVTRGMKAFNRKWGFKPISTIMERRV
jgi:hypothetical protein